MSEVYNKGTHEEMDFPLMIEQDDMKRLYSITYSIDRNEETERQRILRKEKIFSENWEYEEEKIREIMPPLEAITFEYAGRPEKDADIEWQDIWDEGQMPYGIRISLETKSASDKLAKLIFF